MQWGCKAWSPRGLHPRFAQLHRLVPPPSAAWTQGGHLEHTPWVWSVAVADHGPLKAGLCTHFRGLLLPPPPPSPEKPQDLWRLQLWMLEAGGPPSPGPPPPCPSHCSACPWGQGSAWVLQQLMVLTPGKWGPDCQDSPPDHHHSPGLSKSEGPGGPWCPADGGCAQGRTVRPGKAHVPGAAKGCGAQAGP